MKAIKIKENYSSMAKVGEEIVFNKVKGKYKNALNQFILLVELPSGETVKLVEEDYDIIFDNEDKEDAENYKGYKKVFIGCSSIGSLTLRGEFSTDIVQFAKDGYYTAYIVDDKAIISSRYHLASIISGKSYRYKLGDIYEDMIPDKTWLKIYDDNSLVLDLEGKKFKIYRAGNYECIIQIL